MAETIEEEKKFNAGGDPTQSARYRYGKEEEGAVHPLVDAQWKILAALLQPSLLVTLIPSPSPAKDTATALPFGALQTTNIRH